MQQGLTSSRLLSQTPHLALRGSNLTPARTRRNTSSTPNHLEHQSLTPSPIFHLHFFLSKGWRGQRTWAGVGRCWRTGWTGATSNGPLSPSRLLSKLLLFPSRCNVSTFSPFAFISLSPFYLRACLSARLESVNLMKSKVKHWAGIRRHPRDNHVCFGCLCVCVFARGSTESRCILQMQREAGG